MFGSVSNPASLSSAVVLSVVAGVYEKRWFQCIHDLYSVMDVTQSVDGLTRFSNDKRLFYYSGMGTWSQHESKRYMCDMLSAHKDICNEIDKLYAEYEKSIALPENFLVVGNLAFIFVPSTSSDLSFILSFVESLATNLNKKNVTQVLFLVRQPNDLLRIEGAKEVMKSFSTKLSEERVEGDQPAPKLTGKHEILYGAQYGSSTPIAITDFTAPASGTTALFAALKKWQKQSVSASRTVTIVSCAWLDGCNFTIVDHNDSVFLTHYSLLPTSDNISNSILNEFSESVGRKFKTNILESSKLRCLELQHHDGVINYRFPAVDDKADAANIVSSASIIEGPTIANVESTFVTFSLRCNRMCTLTLKVYQVPHGMALTDMEVLAKNELSLLQACVTESVCCISPHRATVKVHNLTPYTSYCAVFTDSSTSDTLSMTTFTTIQHESSRIFISFLCGITHGDITCGSDFSLLALDQFDSRFSSVGPVHMCYGDCGGFLHKHHSMLRLHSVAYVDEVHHCPRCVDSDTVMFRTYGLFAELTLKCDAPSCFERAASVIDELMSVKRDIMTLTVYLSKPAVSHAVYSPDLRKWLRSKHSYHYMMSMERFLSKLFLWKAQSPYRDALMLCVLDIFSAQFFIFQEPSKSMGIRHVLLPCRHIVSTQTSHYIFPPREGKIRSISYTSHALHDLQTFGKISIVEPLLHLHNADAASHDQTILYKQFTMSPSPELTEGYTSYHPVILKKILQDIDNFSIVLGPVLMNVTTSSCMVSFEFNRKLDNLECILRSTIDANDVHSCVVSIKAYAPSVFVFDALKSGSTYAIYVPTSSHTALGRVRTISTAAQFTDVIFIGDQELERLCSVPRIVDDMHVQSFSCIETVEMESSLMALMNLSHNPSMNESWLRVGEYLSELAASCDAVIYVGSHALLSKVIRTVISPLVRLLEQSGSDQCVVGRLFLANVETAVEDTFRLLWMMEPAIKLVLRSQPNTFLYHPDYLLDFLDTYAEITNVNAKNAVHDLFQRKLQDYIFVSRQWNIEKVHHFYTWRVKCLSVMSIDFCQKLLDEEVSENSDEEEDEAKPVTEKTPFSANFMTAEQWWYVRKNLADKSIFQLVFCLSFPLIPLSIDTNRVADRSEDDVLAFLNYLVKWLSMNENRTIVLVCTSSISCVTVIQDIKSGVKIIQCCVGPIMHQAEAFLIPKDETRGKYGHFRYVHRMVGLKHVLLESCAYGNGGRYTGDGVSIGSTGVFAHLRFWFDTWKANGLFSIIPVHQIQQSEVSVIVGPVVGAPRVIETSEGDRIMIPVLFEVDGDTTLQMTGLNVFTGQVLAKSHELKKYTPTVILFGPLHIDSRFVFRVVSGVQNVHSLNLVLHTSINWNENNIAVINCSQATGAPASLENDKCTASSTFLRDLVTRCRIPFSGLTAVVHTNISIDIHTILEEARRDTRLEELLQTSRGGSGVSSELRNKLETVFYRIRKEYRNYLSKPSYMNLLRSAHNLFMFAKQVQSSTDDISRMVYLINARVRQEYFDQLVAPPESVFAALPKTDVKLQEDLRKTPVATFTAKCTEFDTVYAEYIYHTNYPLPHMPILDESDEDILRIPRKRRPDLICQDPSLPPIDAVINQFAKQHLASPPLWVPWYAPNDRVVIEDFCDVSVDDIREIHDRILKSDVDYGSRIIIVQDATYLFQQKSLMGYKLCLWINKWIGMSYDKSISLLCPALNGEGSRRHDIAYFDESNWLSIYSLAPLYHSNEEVIAQLKLEKFGEKKRRTTKSGGGGRRATERRKLEEAKKEEAMRVELAKIFETLPPDGYFIFEIRAISSKSDSPVFISTSNCRAISSQTLTSETENFTLQSALGDKYVASMYDYLDLPSWFQKLCPGQVGHYIQDEVAFLIQQEGKSRAAMHVLEADEEFRANVLDVYKSSNLNELQLAPAMRRIDFSKPGVVLYFLKSIVENIWENHIPAPLKSRMVPLSDDFIFSFCFYPAITEVSALSSPESFLATFSTACTVAVKIFLTTKMRLMKRWQYLLDVPEFIPPIPDYVESEDELEIEKEEKGEEEQESAINDAAVIEEKDTTYDSKLREQSEEEAKLSESEKAQREEELKRQEAEKEYYSIVERLQGELAFAGTARVEARRHYANIIGFIPSKI